jgi:hypothetical protein
MVKFYKGIIYFDDGTRVKNRIPNHPQEHLTMDEAEMLVLQIQEWIDKKKKDEVSNLRE